jgi:hypothetical protein
MTCLSDGPTKDCFKCGNTKPLSEFYAHPKMADGHLNKCKSCTKRDVSRNYRSKRQQYAEYDRRRWQVPERRSQVQRNRRRLSERDPVRERAYRLVRAAIRAGKLKREPCVLCKRPRTEAHHFNYARPLAVSWLCRRHHMWAHGKEAW